MLVRLLILLVRIYQWTLSPLFGNVCRFHPSCSRYAILCLEGHGAFRGGWLAIKRLGRCHPFNPGGYDPPPAPASEGYPTSTRPGDGLASPIGKHGT